MLIDPRQVRDIAAPQRWLACIRGDRRPLTVHDLEHAIAAVAADEGVDVAAVRAGLDSMLADAGGLDAWEQLLRRPLPKLGRALDRGQDRHASELRTPRSSTGHEPGGWLCKSVNAEPTPTGEKQMSLLDLIRTRRHEKQAEGAVDYWTLLAEQPANGRKGGDAVAAFEAALAATGKTLADAEHDRDLLEQVATLGDLAERERVAEAEGEKLCATAKQANAQAAQFEAKAAELRKQATAAQSRASSLRDAAAGARGDSHRLRHLLAQRGHPASVAALQRASIEAQLQTVRAELVGAREHLAGVEELANDGRSKDEAAPLPLLPARRRVAELEARERALGAELGGCP